MKASARIKEKRASVFQPLDLFKQFRAVAVRGFPKASVFGKFPWFNYAMFKIKSLRYKDLILNSTGCRKSNRLLRQPAYYRIFTL